MDRIAIVVCLMLGSGCERDTQTTAPDNATPAPIADSAAGRHGIGHCCKDGDCAAKQYDSAKEFAHDCSEMEATEARWCDAKCEVIEEPYACDCPQ